MEKKSLDGFNSRLNTIDEDISKLEHIPREILQTETQREKECKTHTKHQQSMSHYQILSNVYVTVVPEEAERIGQKKYLKIDEQY